MIRKFRNEDLEQIMQLWLQSNIQAHGFIEKTYWKSHYSEVRKMMPEGEIYVFDSEDGILGFLGLQEDYIAGIFVNKNNQSRGIGKQLLDYVKEIKETLNLSVYQKNIRAISFYQREQFVIQSEHIDNDNNEKEFIMTWNK